MKRLFLFLALIAGSLNATLGAAPEDGIAAARNTALDMAGAWTNDGFKLRDAYWSGTLNPKEAKIVQVNLYAGNQYWFTLGVDKAKKVEVTVFDETGKPVVLDTTADDGRAAAGFCPTTSGPYLVKVQILEGDASSYALVYSYK